MQLQKELQERNVSEISIYQGPKAEPRIIATEIAKLKAAFPSIEMSFISLLSERIRSNDFTEDRLKEAIADVIDNFKYKTPNIADIIAFDKKIKLHTRNEAYMLIEKGECSGWDDFRIIDRNNRKFWVRLTEV